MFLCAMAALIWAKSAQAICPSPVSASELRQAAIQGENAFSDMNVAELLQQAQRAREQIVVCVAEPISPSDAAAFHRLMALDAFTRHNDARVIAEFHAARRLEPGYELPESIAPVGHRLNELYARAANEDDGLPESVFAPEGGYAIVGGVRNAPRLSSTPLVIQVYGPKDVWIETRYIQLGEKLPVWGKNVYGVTAKDLGLDTTPTWKKPAPWYIVAGVSTLVAGTFYALALREKSFFNAQSTPDSDLPGYRDRANAFGWTAVGTAGLAVVLTGIGVGFQIGFGDEEDP
ncbi:hypothetical protein HY771_03585 [Candidatus Uhrbacteria bacterium]|nr:hypothetical protein [Candidatus Uhrbacteria bacterium]